MAFQQATFDEESDADAGVGRFVEFVAWLAAEDDSRRVEDGPRTGGVPLDAGVDLAQRGEIHGVAPGQSGLRRAVR